MHVVGSKLENANGNVVHLHGVDTPLDGACEQSNIFGVTTDPTQATVNNMIADHINAVRITMDEDCWLGINGVPSATGGVNYQTAIENWVNLLTQNGIYSIVDLHLNAPGTERSTSQQDMADESHAPAFWTSVATAFKGNDDVIFDLYNEPHDISWECWRDGGCTTPGFQVAGMQQLVNVVRATGANNVLLLGCLGWGGGDCADSSGSWVQYVPTDPDHNLVAGGHVYVDSLQTDAWMDSQYLPIIQAGYPFITGEFAWCDGGGNNCGNESFATNLMNWEDQNGGSGYIAWAWASASAVGSGFPLIASSDGSSLTSWGQYLAAQYAQRFPGSN